MEVKKVNKKQVKSSLFQKMLFAIVMLVFVFSMVKIATSIAAVDSFEITSAQVTSKSETTEINDFTYESSKITKDIVYHKVGDSVVYQIKVKNNDNVSYIIKSVTDDNENPYITYEYDSYVGTKIDAGGDFTFIVTEKYASEVQSMDERFQNFSVKFLFKLEDEDGNETQKEIPVNNDSKPKTGDEVMVYFISAILALLIMLALLSKKETIRVSKSKVKYAKINSESSNKGKHNARHGGKGFKFFSILLIAAILIPKLSKAVSDLAFTLTFENAISLKDKLCVSYEIDGVTHETVVDYDSPIGEIEDPEKDGYDFIGWEDENGDEFDPETTPVVDDVKITPVYRIIHYAITYNGLTDEEKEEANNPTSYTIEESISINDPAKEGNVFTGWSGTDLSGENNKNISIPQGSTGDREYTAHFSVNTYTIILDLDGGEGTTEITREYGEPIGEIPEPTKDGYDFDGWYTEEDGAGDEVTEDTPVTGEMEIHANWKIINYTITYDGLTDDEKEELNNESTYTIESSSITLKNPDNRFDNDGDLSEIFIGWNDGTSTSINVTIPAGSTGNKTYTAMWQTADPDTYVITYDLNGDSVTVTNPSSYTKFDADITLNNPTREGYTFTGWSGTDLVGDNNLNVTIPTGSRGDRTYTAHWSLIEYTITYNGLTEEEKQAANNPTSYTIEENNITLTNPTREGYTFTGWSGTDLSGDDNLNVVIPAGSTGNREYTAHYQINVYTITFDSQGGSDVASKNVEYNSPLGTLETPIRPGYTFDGWYSISDPTTEVTENTLCTGDDTLYAYWTIEMYTITYNGLTNEELSDLRNPTAYTVEDSTITLNNPQDRLDEDGDVYESFAGWQEGDDPYNVSTYITIEQGSTGNKTFTAIWNEVDPPTYTITYNTHGFATDLQNPEFYTKKTETFTLSNAEAPGYIFKGWSGTGLIGDENKIVTIEKGSTGDRSYELHMTPITYDITFDANGGQGEQITETYTYDVNGHLPANPYTKEGYTFVEWNESADGLGNGQQPGDNVLNKTTVDRDVLIYYAIWEPNTYTISYNANTDGATGEMQDQQARYDEIIRLMANAFEKLGFKFDGWDTLANGTGTRYADEAEVINLATSGTVDLYAQWAVTPYTIIFDKNNENATGTMENMRVPYGEAVNLNPITYTYTDHKLVEWNTKADGTGTGYADEAEVINLDIDGEVTLYAQWRDVEAIFALGMSFNTKAKALASDSLANITAVRQYTGMPDVTNFTEDNIVSAETSPDPIYAWFDNGTLYYWSEDSHPALNNSAERMFESFSNATVIEVGNFDTSNTTVITRMFQLCGKVEQLDVDGWNTENINHMGALFDRCSSLESIDITGWNTEKVTAMYYMFADCSKLESIDISNMNTSNVTDMNTMFQNCTFTELDLSSFNTSKVTNMSHMFKGCSKLVDLNMGDHFDTSEVKNMFSMFNGCSSLSELDVSRFNTAKVGNMREMFRGLKVTELDLSSFDTSNVTNMLAMFAYCSNLESINFGNSFNTEKVTTMGNLFSYCKNLESIDLSGFNTSNVTDMNEMFIRCEKLKEIDISNFDTSKVADFHDMFSICLEAKVIDLGLFNMDSATRVGSLFSDDDNLTTIYVDSDFDDTYFRENTGTAFIRAYHIVGGAGTTYIDASYEYAHIDGGPSDPGYFTDKSRLNIIYYPNGNNVTGTMTNQTTQANTDIQLNANQYVNLGFAFGGWNTKPDGSGTHYDDGQVVNARGLLQLYAQWGVTPYTVIFDKNAEDATGTMANIQKAYGEHFNLPANAYTRDGFVFKGWNTKADGTGTHYDNEQEVINLDIDGEVTLYVEWKERTATFDVGSVVNAKMKMLSNSGSSYAHDNTTIISFQKSDIKPEGLTSDNLVSSATSNFPIYMWFDNGTMYWYSEVDTIYLNKDSNRFFSRLNNMTDVDVSQFDTSRVENMHAFFHKCYSLQAVDISTFDTSNVKNMQQMFYENRSLTDGSLNLGNIDTSNVTTMESMFQGCTGFTQLNVCNLNTSNVTNIDYMFAKMDNLTSIDLSTWDVSNVTRMSNTFRECYELETINIDNWNTSSVDTFFAIFVRCYKLKNIDLSNIDTSSATNLEGMFKECKGFTILDLSTWDTSNVKNMQALFSTTEITTIYVSDKFKTTNVTLCNNIFEHTPYLVGGAGTAWSNINASNINYAQIDDPDNGAPGYFTDIADKPSAGTNSTNSVNPLSASPASVNAPLNTNMVTPNGINGRTLNTNIDENTGIDDEANIDADTNGDLNTNTEVDSMEELDNGLDKKATGSDV